MNRALPTFALPPSARVRTARAGSAMIVALLTVFVLSLIAANVLTSISSRYNSVYRSASWNEALLTADSGVDMMLAEVARQIPDVTVSSVSGLGAGFSQSRSIPANTLQFTDGKLPLSTGDVALLQLNSGDLTHGGEGGTVQQASVSLQVKTLNDVLGGDLTSTLSGLVNGGSLQVLRLRSTGTVYLTGGGAAGPSRQDNELWKPSLFTNRLTGAAISKPLISRQVEVILRPVRPYEAALVSDDAVLATKAGVVFDSFNSALPLYSTNGQYDSSKRLPHGSVRTNGSTCRVGSNVDGVNTGSMVYGDVGTNGGAVAKNASVTGTVSNSSYVPLPLVNVPSWTPNTVAFSFFGGDKTVYAGTAVTPARVRISNVSDALYVSGLPGTYAEIYVDGDVTGGITVDNGVTVKLYVSGNIDTKASKLRNNSGVASALQIYGVYKDASSAPLVRLNMDAALAAALYAPGHKVYLNGKGDFSGAIVGSRFEANDAVHVHFDEALAYNVGPLLRYQIASWQEIVK